MLLQLADQKYCVTLESPCSQEYLWNLNLQLALCVPSNALAETTAIAKLQDRCFSRGTHCMCADGPCFHMHWLKHICDTASSVCGCINVCEPTMTRFLDTQQPGFTKDTETLQVIIPCGMVAVSSQKLYSLTRLSGQVCRCDLKERPLCIQRILGDSYCQ